jgi:hypothetical protein
MTHWPLLSRHANDHSLFFNAHIPALDLPWQKSAFTRLDPLKGLNIPPFLILLIPQQNTFANIRQPLFDNCLGLILSGGKCKNAKPPKLNSRY